MRPKGTGTIETMPDGRFRPRMPDKTRTRLRPCATYEAAERLLDAALAERSDGTTEPGGFTLRSWGAAFLDRRDTGDLANDRSRWGLHVDESDLAGLALATIQRADIVRWLDWMLTKQAAKGQGHKSATRRKLGRTTVKNALNLLRVGLQAAVERGHLPANPARDVRLPKARGVTHDPWTYLLPDELERLLAAPPRPEDRRLIGFAVDTKVRQGEQWALELRDVHLRGPSPHAMVRYGGPGHRPTKSGKVRRVDLFGMALRAATEQVEYLRSSKRPNPRGLLWPSTRGEWRRVKKPPRAWAAWLKTANLDKAQARHDGQSVHWHSLRHTGASLRLGGFCEQAGRIVEGGRRWSLEELKGMLGHASITTTERYAHLIPSALTRAARESDDASRDVAKASAARALSVQHASSASASEYQIPFAPPAEIESATFGLGRRSTSKQHREVRSDPGLVLDAEGLAVDLLAHVAEGRAAIAAGGPGAWRGALAALSAIEARVLAARESASGDSRKRAS